MIYKIALTTFTSKPKGYKHGLKFISKCIIPIWDRAKKIEINMDVFPEYPKPFLKGAFIGLSKMYGYQKCQEKIVIVTDKTELKKEILIYLRSFSDKLPYLYHWNK